MTKVLNRVSIIALLKYPVELEERGMMESDQR
jgi:hypothetical protein